MSRRTREQPGLARLKGWSEKDFEDREADDDEHVDNPPPEQRSTAGWEDPNSKCPSKAEEQIMGLLSAGFTPQDCYVSYGESSSGTYSMPSVHSELKPPCLQRLSLYQVCTNILPTTLIALSTVGQTSLEFWKRAKYSSRALIATSNYRTGLSPMFWWEMSSSGEIRASSPPTYAK